jgi:ADP-heptose:LPS heptosyltransferase
VDILASLRKQMLRLQMKDISSASLPANIKNIWLVFGQLLGDLLLVSPVPRLVKEQWPDSKMTVVVNSKFKQVWEYNPYVDRIIELPGYALPKKHGMIYKYGDIAKVAKIGRVEGVDLMLCMDHTSYGIYLGMLTHPQFGVGICNKKIGKDHWSKSFTESKINRSLLYQQMVNAAGINIDGWKQEIYWPTESDSNAKKLLEGIGSKLKIGLAPWTSMHTKDWPLDQVISFCDETLIKGYSVVLLGVKSNSAEAELVISKTRHKPLNLVGKTSILDLAATINQLDAIVGCDSGISHLAATLNKPLIVLFSFLDPEIWKPFSRNMTIFKKEKCVNCLEFECLNPHCMNFSAEEVLSALEERLRYGVGGDNP